jgi:hypothetical protein
MLTSLRGGEERWDSNRYLGAVIFTIIMMIMTMIITMIMLVITMKMMTMMMMTVPVIVTGRDGTEDGIDEL